MPVSQLAAEALAAVTGPSRILEGGPAVSPAEGKRAVDLPGKMVDALKRFLARSEFEFQDDVEPHPDYFATLKRLSAYVPLEKRQPYVVASLPLLQGFEDQAMGLAYAGVLDKQANWLKEQIPRAAEMSLWGDRPLEPSRIELGTWWRTWEVAGDPMTVLRDLAEGILVTDQVMTVQNCYPALYDALKMTLLEQLAERRAADEEWEPPLRKQRQLEVLLNISAVSPEFAKELQDLSTAARAGQEGGLSSAPLDIDVKGMELPSQRLQAR